MSALDLADGLHADLSMEEYHALPYVGHSRVLSKMRRSPQFCNATKDAQDEDTDATLLGTALHTLLLCGKPAFERTFAVLPPCEAILKSGKRKDSPCGASASYLGMDGLAYCGTHSPEVTDTTRTILSVEESQRAHRMAGAVNADKDAADVLRLAPQREVTILWTDPETRLRCKGRADILGVRPGLIQVWDLKKSVRAHPDSFAREILRCGYHRQLAHYDQGLRVLGLTPNVLGFVVVNDCAKDDVHEVGTYELIADALEAGREDNRAMLRRYADCLATGQWPGFGRRFISIPAYGLGVADDGDEEVE